MLMEEHYGRPSRTKSVHVNHLAVSLLLSVLCAHSTMIHMYTCTKHDAHMYLIIYDACIHVLKMIHTCA